MKKPQNPQKTPKIPPSRPPPKRAIFRGPGHPPPDTPRYTPPDLEMSKKPPQTPPLPKIAVKVSDLLPREKGGGGTNYAKTGGGYFEKSECA